MTEKFPGLHSALKEVEPLSQIIHEYDWRENPIIRTLVEEGPISLVKNAEGSKFRLQQGRFVNKCQLCIEIRKTLRKSGL